MKTNKEQTENQAEQSPEVGCCDLLAPFIQTCFVFAARYTHHRNTGGTLAVVTALKTVWRQLSNETQSQIVREMDEATCNKDEWMEFKSELLQQLTKEKRDDMFSDIPPDLYDAEHVEKEPDRGGFFGYE